jgi:hypothetical protein
MSPVHLLPYMVMSEFLLRVSLFSEENMMPVSNLAVCFGPTFARLEVMNAALAMRQVERIICERLLNLTPRLLEEISAEQKGQLSSYIKTSPK